MSLISDSNHKSPTTLSEPSCVSSSTIFLLGNSTWLTHLHLYVETHFYKAKGSVSCHFTTGQWPNSNISLSQLDLNLWLKTEASIALCALLAGFTQRPANLFHVSEGIPRVSLSSKCPLFFITFACQIICGYNFNCNWLCICCLFHIWCKFHKYDFQSNLTLQSQHLFEYLKIIAQFSVLYMVDWISMWQLRWN